jgi:hypothetical protein
MRWHQITFEKALIALILFLAVGVRLFNLGRMPLSDGEASWALQSMSIARGAPVEIGPQPGEVTLTGLAFILFGGSNFMARLYSAIAGSLLVATPLFFRRRLGSLAVLILMTGLALDPGLVVMSRTAGGPMGAIGFGTLALALAYARQPLLAGVAAGLALLSGPAVIAWLISLGLAWGFTALLHRSPAEAGENVEVDPSWLHGKDWPVFLISALATLLLAGTLFLRVPQGLSAWMSALPAYLRGWVNPSGTPALRLVVALLVYQPLASIFGLLGIVSGWLRRDRLVHFLSLWFAFSLLLSVIYPGRQMGDLVWSLLPLWALAAWELAHLLGGFSGNRWVPFAQALVVFILLVLFWLNLLGLAGTIIDLQASAMRLGLLAGLLGLIAILSLLVGMGWSWDAARMGFVCGICAALGLYGLSALWHASQLRVPGQYELWQPVPEARNSDLLIGTIEDLSEWNTGLTDEIDLTLADQSPSLRWELRKMKKLVDIPADQVDVISGTPSLVIARLLDQTPRLAETYRGQDFGWWVSPAWQGALPPDFLRWVTTHQAPLQLDQVIVWARSDLFPGESAVNQTAPASQPVDKGGSEQ